MSRNHDLGDHYKHDFAKLDDEFLRSVPRRTQWSYGVGEMEARPRTPISKNSFFTNCIITVSLQLVKKLLDIGVLGRASIVNIVAMVLVVQQIPLFEIC